MSHGIPVLASHRTATSEVVGQGEQLLSASGSDPWCAAVERWADPAVYREGSSRALAQARTFAPDRTTAGLIRVYDLVVNTEPAPEIGGNEN